MRNSFAIENIDCPMCALKIEEALNQLPGVSHAAVDFTNQRLHLDADDLDAVRTTIARLEPGVTLTALDDRGGVAEPQGTPFALKRELTVLGVALLLFGGHWLFAEWLRAWGVPGLHLIPALTAYVLAGANVYRGALRTVRRGDFFDENVLMVIATVGAFAIDAVAEAVAVMIFFKTGELLQNLAVARSRRSIRALLSSRPDTAHRQTAAGLEAVRPEQVQVGDTIVVRPGEKVALDGEVLSGDTRLDTSALTGEPA
ncbi:MAG: heavy metal translocating P-type ATPase, partial [Desulfatitalea sp.]|nr:heavy metal translocating P-type ATPase [Desulfatitalea sp.]